VGAKRSGSRRSRRHGQNGRVVVVGRKNRYGSRSRRGSEVAAILYSLLETAKLVGVDPREYLRAALAAHVERGEALIPHDMLTPLQAAAA
jgi:hypothetical protein